MIDLLCANNEIKNKLIANIAHNRKVFSIFHEKDANYIEYELLDYKYYMNYFYTPFMNILGRKYLLIILT